MDTKKSAYFFLCVFNNEEHRSILNTNNASIEDVINALFAYGFRDKIPEFIFSYLETEDSNWEFDYDWSVSIEYLGSK